MTGGYKSNTGFWLGGLSSNNTVHSGYRGWFGFWLGGLCSAPTVTHDPGYRSWLGFWVGGMGNGTAEPPSTASDWIIRARRRGRR